MVDELDAAREYERLRSELTAFVLDALAEQIASGAEPELGERLIAAIERQVDSAIQARVDEVIAARVDAIEWPDPDVFADAVAAAVARREASGATRRPVEVEDRPDPRRRADGLREPSRATAAGSGIMDMVKWLFGALILGGIIALAIWFFFLKTPPQTNTQVITVPPTGGIQQLPASNLGNEAFAPGAGHANASGPAAPQPPLTPQGR